MLRSPNWFARLRGPARPIVSRPKRDKLSLLVEQLECREVPANVISGNVFEDFNFNGVRDTAAAVANAGGATGSSATTVALASGGSGYAVGDVLTVVQGTATTNAQTTLRVTAVGAGGTVTAVNFVHRGNYTTAPVGPVTTTVPTGGGTGATFNLTYAVDTTPLAVDAGVGGITVTVTGDNGFSDTVTSAADGTFTITDSSGVAGTQYRVQFTNLPTGFTDTAHGADALSSVRFVTGNGLTPSVVDYGIARASDYFPETANGPTLITEYYHPGGGAAGGNTTQPVIVSVPYNGGSQSNDPTFNNYLTGSTVLATVGQVGTTFGLAYNAYPTNPVVYAAAFQKTYAGYAYNVVGGATVGGTGAIYSVRADGNGVSLFADLNTIVGAGTAGVDPHDANPANDNAAALWGSAGKISLGGMALSADGTRLYVMNLADRTLYALSVKSDGTYGGSYYTIAIPNWGSVPGATGATGTGATSQGDLRPLAVTVFGGNLYVGMVNSAETTQNKADLNGYVYTVADSGSGLTFGSAPVLQFDLDYLRGSVNQNSAPDGDAAWLPWRPTDPNGSNWPMPELATITFDAAGNMTLGLRDRFGDTRSANGGPMSGFTAGDTLRAGLNPVTGQYTLENLGRVTVSTNPYGSTFTNTTVLTGSNANAGYNGPGSLPAATVAAVTGDAATTGASKSGTTVTIRTTAAHGFSPNQTVQITGMSVAGYNGTYTITSVTSTSFSYEQADAGVLATSGGGQARVSGKFYYQDTYGGITSLGMPHSHIGDGGVFQLPGFQSVIVSTLDSAYGTAPGAAYHTGGLSWYNTTDGTNTKDFQLYTNNSSLFFGKSNGAGAIVAAQPLAPVAIGNRVWLDKNGNGVQDAGDTGIKGVTVQLFAPGGALLATAVTDDNGNYSFSSDPSRTADTTTSDIFGITGLKYGTAGYTVTFDATTATGFSGLVLTADNRGGDDELDSDAVLDGAVGKVTVDTGKPGSVDHSIDAGYYQPVKVGNFVWEDGNGNGVQDSGEAGINGVHLTLTGTDGAGNPVTRTTTTADLGAGDGGYLFDNLAPGTYTVSVDTTNPALAGYIPTATGKGTTATDSNPSPSGTTPGALPSGSSDLTLDFGYVEGVTIGSFVWHDTNGNGVQDSGEPGIGGVTLTLTGTDASGTPVADTATTDGNGHYSFTERPGTYTVSIDGSNFTGSGALVGHAATATGKGTTATDSDNPAGTTTPALAAGDSDPDIDFGFYQPVSVGNFVWEDSNGNGVQDPGEAGINGVALTLTGTDGAGNPVTRTATTADLGAGDGAYLFDNLPPGTYTVTVDSSNFDRGALSGYRATAPGKGTPATDSNANPSGTSAATSAALASGDSDPTLDFGYYKPVTVGNFVWLDADRDGIQDRTETGINGVHLTLTGTDGAGNPVTRTTTTADLGDGDGAYRFDGLAPGTYTVAVDDSNSATGGALWGYVASPTGRGGDPARDSNVNPSGTTPGALPSGTDDTSIDFGYYPTADLSLTKTVDRTTAPVGTNVTFTITVHNDGPLDATGVTVLDQLPSGFNFVSSDDPVAYDSGTGVWTIAGTLPVGETRTLRITATVVASGNYTNAAEIATSGQPDIDSTPGNGPQGTPEDDEDTATVTPPSSLAGVVYVDSNRDGDRDPGEPGIARVPVTLFNAITGTQVATTTTAADGSYLFANLPAGTYRVVETQPSTYADGAETLGNAGGTISANDTFAGIVLPPGTVGTGYNFGEIRPGLSGTVFFDADKDGALDPGETGLPGVRVSLRNAAGKVVGVRTTDANGNYVFPDLTPGVYTVTETQPTGYGNTPTGPFKPNVRTVRITNQFLTDQNFGDTLGNLSGVVYEDVTNDGVKQGAEAPIPGATVTLINAATGAVVGTTTTAADGTYSFTGLRAGRYRIVETQPAGYSDGKDAVGTVGGKLVAPDTINNITLPVGGTGVNYNFGERPVNGLSGTVYLDRNQDSAYQPTTDRPLAGITVTLRDSGGTVVAATTTAADGSYNFTDLPAGDYTLTETQPASYGDSEVPTNVRTVTVPAAGFVTNQNFGDTLGTISGRVYRDNNLNGTLNTTGANPDTGIGGITVTLLDSNGNQVATTKTAANGTYKFTDLLPDTYTVVETQPPPPSSLTKGFFDGADNLGSLSGTRPAKNSMQLTLPPPPTGELSQNGVNYNFGELPPADPNGFVYVDANRNGIRDPGERGIAGVAITISGTAFAGTPFARPIAGADVPGGSLTVFTNASGFYEFNPIPPGLYTIRERQPVGFIDGLESNRDPSGPAPTIGNDVFSNIVLNPFPIRGPFDFGEFLPVTPSKRNLLGSAM